MANYDRGVYEPSDEVRVFDGSEEEDDAEGSRLPLLIVLALLVLAMFGGVVWLAYTQGVARGRGETPVLTAAAGPEKVAPPQAGGGNVPYQGFKIYEQPAPPDDSADNTPAPPKAIVPEAARPAPAAQVPVETTAKPAPVENKPAPRPAPVAMIPPPKAAPAAMAPPGANAIKQAKPVTPPPAAKPAAAGKPNSVAALIQQANNTPARPAPAPAGPATGAPRALGQPVAAAPKAATPPPAAAAAKPAATGGGYVLQIGAYKSQADADAAWNTYKARHAALLSGYSPDVRQADLGEKGTWYRLRVAGFSDRDVANGVCDRLKADGGACILAK